MIKEMNSFTILSVCLSSIKDATDIKDEKWELWALQTDLPIFQGQSCIV